MTSETARHPTGGFAPWNAGWWRLGPAFGVCLAALASCGGGGGGGGSASQVVFLAPAAFGVVADTQVTVQLGTSGGALKSGSAALTLNGQPVALASSPGGFSAQLTGLSGGTQELAFTAIGGDGAPVAADLRFEVYAGGAPGPDALAGPFATLGLRGGLLFGQTGGGTNQRFGERVLLVDDVDGDQCADLAVAAPPGLGRVRMLSGRTGAFLWETQGLEPGEQFGRGLGRIADWDGDGISDLLVGAPLTSDQRGRVDVLSGASGARLVSFLGPAPATAASDEYASAVVGLSDLNGDGVPDFAAGAPKFDGVGTNSGRVDLRSGSDGALLWSAFGATQDAQFGVALAVLGDVDGDGAEDLIAGAWGDKTVGPSAGAAEVLSGASGARIHLFLADAAQDHFGFSVGAAGDVDGDGIGDAIVGSWEDSSVAFWAGMARVYSGATGAVLHTWYGSAAQDKFGGSVAGAGDVNGDGRADLLVGALQEQGSLGGVHLFCGASGERLALLRGFNTNGQLGVWVDGGRDLDGDGWPDFAAGAWLEASNGFNAGAAYAWSQRTVRAVPERPRFSLGSGGSSGFAVDGGVQRAGEPFVVLGTVLPQSAGAPPLLPWPLGLVDPAVAQLVPTAGGLLDGSGRAYLNLVVPTGLGALAGGQLVRQAFLGVAPGPEDASQMVRLALGP